MNQLVELRPRVEPGQYLSFMLGGEVYAIGILSIKEIIEYGGLTAMPMMPGAMRGVINLRGAVVPVMDLAVRLGRPPAEPGRRSCIVIVELAAGTAQQVVGLIVDSVNAVQEIAPGDIEPAPTLGAQIAPQFIAGMAKAGSRFVILLDIAQLLSWQEIAALATPLLPGL